MSDTSQATPIAISGAAVITCLGADRHDVWRQVAAGTCGARRLTQIESKLPAGADGGQAVDLPETDAPSREVRYLRQTIQSAMSDAGIAGDPSAANRRACVLGTTLHGMRVGGDYLRSGNGKSLRFFLAAAVQRAAVEGLGLCGVNVTTCSACSSSLSSIALGITLLRSGKADVVAAGGYDPISEYSYAGFNSLRLVASGALRPFTRNRQGMKVGEGYGIVILERADDLARRSGKPLAFILGYGESSDAHHLTQPHPNGDGAARAARGALQTSRMQPNQIDLIAAHATGTPDNDAAEHAALAAVFGFELANVPVVAFKSHLSHTLGAAGAVELILSAMSMEAETIPPCANVRAEELEFSDLNVSIGGAKPAALKSTLNLSLGFGGANTAMILGRQRPAGTTQPARRPVFISGVGSLIPQAIGNDALLAYLNNPDRRAVTTDAAMIDDERIAGIVSARRIRRMSGYVKLALAAVTLALQDGGVSDVQAFCKDCCAILGTTHGGVHYCHEYYTGILRDGVLAANPMLFAEGVPNAASAHLSLATGMLGGCQTIIGSRTAGLDALGLATIRIASGEWNRAIVAAADEYSPVTNSGYAHCGLYAVDQTAQSGRFVSGWGAAALVLESEDSLASRTEGRRRAMVLDYAARCAPANELATAGDEVLRELCDPETVVNSSNGTWIDREESESIRLSGQRAGRLIRGISPAGLWAECFSAGPLLSACAAILSDRVMTPQSSISGTSGFALLASDYNGLSAGARIQKA